MVRYFDQLAALVMDTLFGDDEEKKDTDFVTRLKQAAVDGVKGFVERINQAVNTIREFQLPQEIVPMDLIGEFVVDRVIANLGGKYKAVAKGGRAVLQRLPGNPWNMIMDKIGRALTQGVGDPNDLYRDSVLRWLQKAIDDLRKEVFSWLQGVFGDVKLFKDLGITVNFAPDAPAAVDFAGIEFHDGDEAEKSPADSEHAPTASGPLGEPSAGERLPRPLRTRAEASLGHDLSHVRLHRGAEAEKVTGRLHADGVASGSHVFLHPTLSLSGGGRGEHVLRHELGHVLQQVGPRPLGQVYDDRPSPGRPGRGLTIDPRREDAAERMAGRAAPPSGAAPPVDVGSAVQGPQPSMNRGFVKTLLQELRDPQQLQEEGKKKLSIGDLASAENELRKDQLNRAVAEQLPAKLFAAIQAMKPDDFQPPFGRIAPKLQAMAVSPDNQEQIRVMIKRLVVSVREPKSPPLKKGEAAGDAGLWLDPEHFARELARYLYALTGLAFQVAFATKKGPESIGSRYVIDLDARKVQSTSSLVPTPAMHVAPFALLQVGHVHLPFLGDQPVAHELWELLATNTFSSEPGFSSEKELWVAATRLALGHLMPKPGMYLQKDFALSALARGSVRSQMKLIRPLAAHWPSPSDYAKSDSSAAADKSDPKGWHIGLRLGTYLTLENERAGAGIDDRDPHHVPQVLLIDYFSNSHKLKAFPALLDGQFDPSLYPKMVASGREAVDQIGPIQIKPFTTGRANDFPAILLARHTHQAEVHVGTEPPDEKSKRATMGGWVQSRFSDALGPDLWKVMGNRSSLAALRDKAPAKVTTPAGVTTTQKDLADGIVSGVRQTYAAMHQEMMAKLKRGLHEQEIPYYNLIAAVKNPKLAASDKLNTTQVDATHTSFKGVVDGIMKPAGFVT
jgi:uncharacterized protein DUF4157